MLRFVVPALGFPSARSRYRREERAAGSSKYPLAEMIRLSLDSLTGFSTAPLRLATWFGARRRPGARSACSSTRWSPS